MAEKSWKNWRSPMASAALEVLAKLVETNEQSIVADWLDLQKKAGALQSGRIQEAELASECREFLHLMREVSVVR
jgi:rsbT co-antagonist protein RsbR